MRTDGKGYHDSIDRHRMLEMISRHIKDRVVLNYLRQARRCPKLPGPVWLPGKSSDAVPLIGRLLDHLVGAQQHGLREVDAMRAVLVRSGAHVAWRWWKRPARRADTLGRALHFRAAKPAGRQRPRAVVRSNGSREHFFGRVPSLTRTSTSSRRATHPDRRGE